MADEEQIIIIKKKGGHGGHHGGAWKVAYADFVTAMMALFIVLWLMNSSKPVQEAVGGYFRDPLGVTQKKGTGLGGPPACRPIIKEDMAKLKEDLMKAMEALPNFDKLKKQIEMTITPEGLRIELMEDPQGTFFENGKAQPTPILQSLLKILAAEVGKLPNRISIEGHTDSKPFSDSRPTATGSYRPTAQIQPGVRCRVTVYGPIRLCKSAALPIRTLASPCNRKTLLTAGSR